MNIKDIVVNMIKFARTTGRKASTSTSQFDVVQVSYLGKAADVALMFQYGSFAKLPADQLLVVLSIAGEEENRVAMGTGNPVNNPDIEDGEVVYFHPQTQSKIVFKNNGDIEITAENDVNMIANGEVNLTTKGSGDINIVPDGSGIVNLGSGGNDIARVGDSVRVTITTGSSAGVAFGNITSAGSNKST